MKKHVLLTVILLCMYSIVIADHSKTGNLKVTSDSGGKLKLELNTNKIPKHAKTELKVQKVKWEDGEAIPDGDVGESTLTNEDNVDTLENVPKGVDILVSGKSVNASGETLATYYRIIRTNK